MILDPLKLILPQYHQFYTHRASHKVALSGRGSGRTVNSTIAVLCLMLQHRDMNVLVLREFQNSLEASSYAEFKTQIILLGLEGYFTFTKGVITCPLTNGLFTFKGINRNPASVKSSSKISIVIFEECGSASQESIDILLPTIREQGSEIWWLGNVARPSDPISKLFLLDSIPTSTIVMNSNYIDNHHCSAKFLQEAEDAKVRDYKRFLHDYMGEFEDVSENSIFDLHVIKDSKKRITKLPTGFRFAGLDVAGAGKDEMVLFIVQDDDVIFYKGWNYTPDHYQFSDQLIPLLLHHDVKSLAIDYKGMGIGIASIMSNRWKGTTYNIDVTKKSNKAGILNLKAEMIFHLKDRMTAGFKICGETKLEEELQVVTYVYVNNELCIDSKKGPQGVRAKLGRSTDYLDALALALHAQKLGCNKLNDSLWG